MESKKFNSVLQAEEEHLKTMSKSVTTKKKTIKKSYKNNLKLEESEESQEGLTTDQVSQRENTVEVKICDNKVATKSKLTATTIVDYYNDKANTETKKIKSKRAKKCDYDNQNISVKSSFSKFDALQKRNLIHVRSSDSSKAQKVFSNPDIEKRANCRQCDKPVYKMEEVVLQFKSDKNIYHKTCLRCKDCGKQLKFDNYQSHEGNLYCNMHFKLLFAPKVVEDNNDIKPRKAELIIRESQPIELPPDVARASDKPDLGLGELQQLNVRSKFQVFENGVNNNKKPLPERATSPVKRSASILSKVSRLQQHGLPALSTLPNSNGISGDESEVDDVGIIDSNGNDEENDEIDEEHDDDDLALVRFRRQTKRERPVGLGDAMNDIRTRFEQGHVMSKEERREERKQEIQNIRSRLFMGKQAKIKEMYQQAVAESEQSVTSSGKHADMEIGEAARSIKERFEKGEMFNEYKGSYSPDTPGNKGGLLQDADVFESAISKNSRCIFMELDANVVSTSNAGRKCNGNNEMQTTRSAFKFDEQVNQENPEVDVVKCDAKLDDIKIATAELSEKFKFFEKYRPNEMERRQFRMTPPREGVVKMPTPDSDNDNLATESNPITQFTDHVLQKTQTTSTMLNKFREMEKCNSSENELKELKPLKCFTPPPEDRRYIERSDSEDDEDSDDNESSNSCDEESDEKNVGTNDESLKEVQMATRAKQLRAKFEKWQANEIEREQNENHVDVYSQQVSDDSNIESTKTIRERFENMKNFDRTLQIAPRHQVNRFVHGPTDSESVLLFRKNQRFLDAGTESATGEN